MCKTMIKKYTKKRFSGANYWPLGPMTQKKLNYEPERPGIARPTNSNTDAFQKDESVDKPGSVVDDHSSATSVTTCL